MKPAVTGRDGHALAERYEQLRQAATSSAGHRGGDGLVLLMRRGMAAWMRSAVDEPLQRPGAAAPAPGPEMPEGIERHLIDILAAMTMATAMELGRDS